MLFDDGRNTLTRRRLSMYSIRLEDLKMFLNLLKRKKVAITKAHTLSLTAHHTPVSRRPPPPTHRTGMSCARSVSSLTLTRRSRSPTLALLSPAPCMLARFGHDSACSSAPTAWASSKRSSSSPSTPSTSQRRSCTQARLPPLSSSCLVDRSSSAPTFARAWCCWMPPYRCVQIWFLHLV